MNTNRFFSNEVLGPKYGKLIQEIFEIPQYPNFYIPFVNRIDNLKKVLDKDIEDGLLTGKCLDNAKQISFYCNDILERNPDIPSQLLQFSNNNKINYLKIIYNPKRKEREIDSIREVMRKSRLVVYTKNLTSNVEYFMNHFNKTILETKGKEEFKSLFLKLAPDILLILFGRYARTIRPEDDAKRFWLLTSIKYYSMIHDPYLSNTLIFFFYVMQGEERIAEYLKESLFSNIEYKDPNISVLSKIPISKHNLIMNKN